MCYNGMWVLRPGRMRPHGTRSRFHLLELFNTSTGGWRPQIGNTWHGTPLSLLWERFNRVVSTIRKEKICRIKLLSMIRFWIPTRFPLRLEVWSTSLGSLPRMTESLSWRSIRLWFGKSSKGRKLKILAGLRSLFMGWTIWLREQNR